MIDLPTGSPTEFSWTNDTTAVIRLVAGLFSDELGAVLVGGSGADVLDGTDGIDLIWGARGDDVLTGGTGDDLVHGGSGADLLAGGAGVDWVQGGSGSDYLSGADLTDPFGELDGAADTLEGGRGDDRLTGGGGDDALTGGRDDDLLAGNEGADVFVFERSAFGHDRIVDFTPGEDRIDLGGLGQGLNVGQIDTNGDGVIGEGDGGVSLQGPSLVLALRGSTIELTGVVALPVSDILI